MILQIFQILFFSLLFTFQLSSNNINDLFIQANVELEKAAEWFKANKLTK